MLLDFEYNKLNNQGILSKNRDIKKVLEQLERELAVLINQAKIKYPKDFTTRNFYRFNRSLETKVKRVLVEFSGHTLASLNDGIKSQWALGNDKNNDIIEQISGYTPLADPKIINSMRGLNLAALDQFITRKQVGLNLSRRVWNIVNLQNQELLELYLGSGITQGRSAQKISQDIRQLLNEPERLFRRVRDAEGNLVLSEAAKLYHPGRGVYRSSARNALRLSANELNMSFHNSDFLRRQKLPFVKGVLVRLSAAHPRIDICDSLKGAYPRGFIFEGWHPICYSGDTEVMTEDGWKFFKDLRDDDDILSLNPKTKDLEYVEIEEQYKHKFKGQMLRFYNNSFDMLVTPEHKMIGFGKANGDLKELSAEEFYNNLHKIDSRNIYSTDVKLYRSSKWAGEKREFVRIRNYKISAELYCEFMGYYLSEGSISRKYAVTISQNKKINPDNYKKISDCLDKMPFKHKKTKTGFNIYDENVWKRVELYGKSHEKFVPSSVKAMNSELIKIFLSAYCLGDGSIKKGKTWKNGTFKNQRSFSTSSVMMAGDIGELLLKIGHRPSFKIGSKKGTIFKHKNGTFASNHDQWIITDCCSQYVSQMKREKIDYNDYVYDIQLSRNHIMYVRRNGKCVWGSNCICYTTTLLYSRKEMIQFLKTGEVDKRQYTRSIPRPAKRYIKQNKVAFNKMKNKPYFLEKNFTKELTLKRSIAL